MNPEEMMRNLRSIDEGSASESEWNEFSSRARRSLITSRVATIAVAVLLVAAGAVGASVVLGGDDPTGFPIGPAHSPSESASSTPAPDTTTIIDDARSVELWYGTDEGLQVTHELVADVAAIGTEAMKALLTSTGACPEGVACTRAPGDVPLINAIPTGTKLLALTIDGSGVATVDFSSAFSEPSGSMAERLRVAQVVYTLTQFPTVDGVLFEIDGKPVDAFGSHGIVLDGPQTRKDFEKEVAPIVVEAPQSGDQVSGSFVLSGTANVFEATVSYRLVSEGGGKPFAEGFTTATCGTGCRGTFEEKVCCWALDATGPVGAVLEVFESSAENGKPLHVVRIPLTLVP
jgi:spore germination protein GerM